MPTKRSFLDYVKTNPLIMVVWIMSSFFATVSFKEEVFSITYFMVFVFLFTLVKGIIDWKKNG